MSDERQLKIAIETSVEKAGLQEARGELEKVKASLSEGERQSNTFSQSSEAMGRKLNGVRNVAEGFSETLQGNLAGGLGRLSQGFMQFGGRALAAFGWVSMAFVAINSIGNLIKKLTEANREMERGEQAARDYADAQEALGKQGVWENSIQQAGELADEIGKAAQAAKDLEEAQARNKSARLASDLQKVSTDEARALAEAKSPEARESVKLKAAEKRAWIEQEFNSEQADDRLRAARDNSARIESQIRSKTDARDVAQKSMDEAMREVESRRSRLRTAGYSDSDLAALVSGDNRGAEIINETQGKVDKARAMGPTVARLNPAAQADYGRQLDEAVKLAEAARTFRAYTDVSASVVSKSQPAIKGASEDLRRLASEKVAAEMDVESSVFARDTTLNKSSEMRWKAEADRRQNAETAVADRRKSDLQGLETERSGRVEQRDDVHGRLRGAEEEAGRARTAALGYSRQSAGRGYSAATDKTLDEQAAQAGRAVQVLTQTLQAISGRIADLDKRIAAMRDAR